MDIEVIPNTNLYEKDCKKFKMIRKETGETHYYVTLKNNGGRCPCCGKYSIKVFAYKNKKIIHDNKHLIKLANTLDNWKEYIANSFIPYKRNNGETVRLSNGKIEGKNSYIKKMLKLANGYANFDRFRNRAMYCENYYETYSEDKLPIIQLKESS